MPRFLARFCLYLSACACVVLLASWAAGFSDLIQPAALLVVLGFTLGMGEISGLRGYRFTAWIITAVVAAMLYPQAFLRWGDFDLRSKWLILLTVQMVMFGMGTQMRLVDFKGIVQAPRGVVVGLVCQFTIMPFVGYGLARVFNLDPEIAAGIVLIGCCSSGLASNVMTYLAKGNLALSVTVTAITTLIAPIMTPALMKLLAGAMVEVKFLNMMVEIIKMVIVPIGAALLHDYLKTASSRALRTVTWLAVGAVLWYGLQRFALAKLPGLLPEGGLVVTLDLLNNFLGIFVIGLIYHKIVRGLPAVASLMPVLSMAGIVYFTTVTTAAGRDNLLQVGALLFLAAMLHNSAGYFFGYWLSRASGLDKQSCRAVAFEVGLQNGGMASGLAGSMGKLATVGLAAAIFSPWMNVSGSILANYWKRRPLSPDNSQPTPAENS